MFDKQRYVTRGVMADIPLVLQIVMWESIDKMPEPKDYLQVFKLSTAIVDGKSVQKILHTQERPTYKKEMVLNYLSPINEKIFVIDDGTHSTMLLANEY